MLCGLVTWAAECICFIVVIVCFFLHVGFSSFVGNDYVFMTSSPPGVSEAIRRLSFALDSPRDFCTI